VELAAAAGIADIESYIRRSHWYTETRLVFAAGTTVFWVL
jgi:hypothetical protein